MKRFITILIALISIVFTGNAQDHKFQIGVEGGSSISSLRGFDEIVPLEPVVGYSAALSFQINFSNHISLVTGVGFEQKGIQTKDALWLTDENGNLITEHKLRYNYNYVNVPVLAKYTFGQNKFKGFVNIGGYVGVLINRRNILLGYENQTDEQKEASEGVEDFDFGFSAGLGMSYSVTEKLAITLEVRNNLGLYNVSSVPIINDGTNKLNSTNLLIGLNYGFSSKK